MKENNIPDHAEFDGVDNGYDGYDDFVLSWDIDVPTNDQDKMKFRRKTFENLSFKRVSDSLKSNGYELHTN